MDYVVFPSFRNQKIKKPVFIIAAPRSGTTFLFHALAQLNTRFTYFKLWEIIFAPSIIQKYFFLGLIRIDKLIGRPLSKFILGIENILIGNLKKIHLIGLNLPEEDEAILIWDLSSIYLNFFYPDSHFFDDYMEFDAKLSLGRRNRIMRSYHNYLKRHQYVFNFNGEKQFLSKNPIMMCKLESINNEFPSAMILNINRSPKYTIPSTIELNNTLYGLFSSRKSSDYLNQRTKDILIEWYKMSHETIHSKFKERCLTIDFNNLVSLNTKELASISDFLDINDSLHFIRKENSKEHISSNKYSPLSSEELEAVLRELPFLNKYNAS